MLDKYLQQACLIRLGRSFTEDTGSTSELCTSYVGCVHGQAGVKVTQQNQVVPSRKGGKTIIQGTKDVKSVCKVWGFILIGFLVEVQNIKWAVKVDAEMQQSAIPETSP